MCPKLPNICNGCTVWTILEPEIESIATDQHRSVGEQRQMQSMTAFALKLDIAAVTIGCKEQVKTLPVIPAGGLAVTSSEMVEFVSACPAFQSLTNSQPPNMATQ